MTSTDPDTLPQPADEPKERASRTGLVVGVIGALVLAVGVALIVVGFVYAGPGAPAREAAGAPVRTTVPATPDLRAAEASSCAAIAEADAAAATDATATGAAAAAAEATPPAGEVVPATASAPGSSAVTTATIAAAAIKATIARLVSYDFSSLLGTVVRQGKRSTGMVALTFDDGPGQYNEQVLKELRQAGIHATFFYVAGRARDHIQQVRDTLADGNEFGDHTFSHVPIAGMDAARFDAEVGRAQRLFRDDFGFAPKFLRPQGGHQDAHSVAMAKQAGLVVVDWSVHSTDTNKNATVASITRAASAASPGAIVLMHETKLETVEAVPGIIANLKARGLKLVTVSQLLAASYDVR